MTFASLKKQYEDEISRLYRERQELIEKIEVEEDDNQAQALYRALEQIDYEIEELEVFV